MYDYILYLRRSFLKNSEISGVLKAVCVILFLIAGAAYAMWFSGGNRVTLYSGDGSVTDVQGTPAVVTGAVAADRGSEPLISSAEPSESPSPAEIRVNINRADIDELKTLTGIGDSKAAAIVAYRQANGDFASIEDIMLVPGIKEGVFSKIKDSICVGAETVKKSVQ